SNSFSDPKNMRRRSASPAVARLPRYPPAQNDPPLPVITTKWSWGVLAIASSIWASISSSYALRRSGRLRVIQVAWSLCSTTTVFSAAMPQPLFPCAAHDTTFLLAATHSVSGAGLDVLVAAEDVVRIPAVLEPD